MFRCCASVKDGLDVDGHVTVGRTETSNDGETQTLLTTSELDNCAAKDKTWLQQLLDTHFSDDLNAVK